MELHPKDHKERKHAFNVNQLKKRKLYYNMYLRNPHSKSPKRKFNELVAMHDCHTKENLF